jgi:hypothetical protein
MADEQRRRGDNRRQRARGGRRRDDRPGYAPVVFVVARDRGDLPFLEHALLQQRFGVILCESVEIAAHRLKAVEPAVIIADWRDAPGLRSHLPTARGGAAIPIVDCGGTAEWVDVVLRDIREALRAADAPRQ